jgi:hypothetical protein
MEGHRAAYAYYFRMYSKDDAPTSFTEFTDGMKGIGSRVKYNTAQVTDPIYVFYIAVFGCMHFGSATETGRSHHC